MSNLNTDTIAAIATPAGRGGVGIIRISGPDTKKIAQTILNTCPTPRTVHFADFLSAKNEVIDSGLALYFAGPNSFTGEDVLELQGHGGPVIMDLLLQRVLECGARMARPGEFSERAFLNDKIDLAQAEAIADLIDAASTQAALSATRSLQGQFSNKINVLVDALIHLRMYVEAAIDFPEEEIDFLSDGKVQHDLNTIDTQLNTILKNAEIGALLKEGIQVVIAGKPNAGKSSLLNCLSARESAIVTDVAGTTRDILREHINIDGLPLHIIDTAGLRDSFDVVEQEGVRRAYNEIEKADIIILVLDSQQTHTDWQQQYDLILKLNKPIILVWNKIDLQAATIPPELNSIASTIVALSTKTEEGLDALKSAIKANAHFYDLGEQQFIARRRHIDALQRAAQFIESGQQQLQQYHAGELLAEDLLQAQNALSEITGAFTSDDLLGKIFSSFCIGK